MTAPRQAATAARRSCGALAEAPAAGRLPRAIYAGALPSETETLS